MSSAFGQVTDNLEKYDRAGAIEGRFLERFRDRVIETIEPLRRERILDAGSGEGHVTAWVAERFPGSHVTGVDGRPEAVAEYARRNPGADAVEGDLVDLPFEAGSFDLVLCTEVLEHLVDPRPVLAELARVSSGHVLLTVPHEPFFRAGNLSRGRYIARLGSTPGHRSTWGRRGFLRVAKVAVEPVRWFSAFPWQGLLARPGTPTAARGDGG